MLDVNERVAANQMHNPQSAVSSSTVIGATNTPTSVGSINTRILHVPTNNVQPRFISIDANSYSKVVNVPRAASPYITIQPQIIPRQNNTSQQYVQIQLPNMQQGSNFICLQPLSNQSNNTQSVQNVQQNFVSVPANLFNNQVQLQNISQPHLSIQLLQQSNQVNNKMQSEQADANISPKKKANVTPIQVHGSFNGQQILISPQSSASSLVGTVSVGQATPTVNINSLLSQNVQQDTITQNVSAAAFFPASPVRKQAGAIATPVTSSSIFQALQAVKNPTNAPVVNHSTANTLPTVLTAINPQQQLSLQQQRSLTQFVAQHAPQLPNQQLVFKHSHNKNEEISSKGFPGTIMMLGGNQPTMNKQQVIIPKTTPVSNQSSMFVPITMANNVSVLTNPASSLMGAKRVIGQTGPSTTLRIQQQQIAPRSTASTSSAGVNNMLLNSSNQKILIPVQSSNQQQYIIQSVPQKIVQSQQNNPTQVQQKHDTAPASTISKSTAKAATVGSVTDSKPVKKPCNCTKSQCLKLYCECFANGEFCSNCNCRLCFNNINHENERKKAIKACLERNPYAFHPKIGKGKVKGDNERRHTKGCNCRRSGCLKNYCECYEAKILCSELCKCIGCKNFEESADRQTLMHLADAAEVRVLQQNAAKNKLAKQTDNVDKKIATAQKEKLPFNFMTADVSKATCDILLACAQKAETINLSEEETERSIIDEFSRCLNQIIDKANEAKEGKR